MEWHRECELAEVPCEVAIALLVRRPPTWLLPFLQLAANQADPVRPSAPHASSHWYRLRMPMGGPAGRIIWHPHGHARLFTGLTGRLQVVEGAAGRPCTIELDATTEGGEPDVNATAIDAFLALLTNALRGAYSDG